MVDKEIRLQGWYKQSLIQCVRRGKNRARLHASVALALSPVSIIKITIQWFFKRHFPKCSLMPITILDVGK